MLHPCEDSGKKPLGYLSQWVMVVGILRFDTGKREEAVAAGKRLHRKERANREAHEEREWWV